MSESLRIFGVDYTNVTGIKAQTPGGETIIHTAGGGGASNYVKGTFKGTTTGTAMDVNIPYTGNGYPVAIVVFPTEGYANSSTGSFNRTVQRYATSMVFLVKAAIDHAPNYTGAGDYYSGQHRYKSSSSNAGLQTTSSINSPEVCSNTDAMSDAARVLIVRSKNKLSVYIASSSYGFMANIEYTYHIIYSE